MMDLSAIMLVTGVVLFVVSSHLRTAPGALMGIAIIGAAVVAMTAVG